MPRRKSALTRDVLPDPKYGSTVVAKFTNQVMLDMGVGMIAMVSAEDADKALEVLHAAGEDAYILGKIEAGEKTVEIL